MDVDRVSAVPSRATALTVHMSCSNSATCSNVGGRWSLVKITSDECEIDKADDCLIEDHPAHLCNSKRSHHPQNSSNTLALSPSSSILPSPFSTITPLSLHPFIMVLSSVLGFPRIGTFIDLRAISMNVTYTLAHIMTGANREVKKAVEAYWAGKLSADELTKAAADVKKASWTSLKDRGVNLIPRYVHPVDEIFRSYKD